MRQSSLTGFSELNVPGLRPEAIQVESSLAGSQYMVLNNQELPGTGPVVPQQIPVPFPCLLNQNMQL